MQYSILIVDDMLSNIMIVADILKSEYNLLIAQNGRDAIRVATEKQPDVILLDVIMPVMDGYEVITALKQSERTSRIPVIFITGLQSVADEEKGLALQAADYISKPFSPAIVRLRVRNQIQIVSQLRTIEELSMTDQLTGIPNRRSFDARLALEWSRAVREGIPLTLLMVDVDNFKTYNDIYGHQQGDAALRTVAQSFMRSVKRATDFYARWGGEEFSILLSGLSPNEATQIAERVRREVAEAVIPGAEGASAKIQVSIGVCTCVPTPQSKVSGFIGAADDALYSAKQAGRNRVVCAPQAL